ncbi:MAG: DUF488 domain-containing protein [Planctomycetota bacterium]
MRIFTIGFTKKSAEEFFTKLCTAGVKRVIDARLKNTSHLAGFAKRDDLRYFLRAVCNMDYVEMPDLAPTAEMVDQYKKQKGEWSEYERQFLELISERKIDETISRELLDGACLLCSEDEPDHCHRRLLAEYLSEKWGGVEIIHIV